MSVEQELGKLICKLNPYSTDMQPGAGALAVENGQEQFPIEIDNYEGEWGFKNNIHKVTRTLRITYRYPLNDKDGQLICMVTEHLLVGYAGGNGG